MNQIIKSIPYKFIVGCNTKHISNVGGATARPLFRYTSVCLCLNLLAYAPQNLTISKPEVNPKLEQSYVSHMVTVIMLAVEIFFYVFLSPLSTAHFELHQSRSLIIITTLSPFSDHHKHSWSLKMDPPTHTQQTHTQIISISAFYISSFDHHHPHSHN